VSTHLIPVGFRLQVQLIDPFCRFSYVRMMELSSVNKVLTFWLTAEAALDVIIAGTLSLFAGYILRPMIVTDSLVGILLYTLNSSRTGMRKSDKVLDRLMRMSMQTGESVHVSVLDFKIF
jgi:hypothetical protein